MATAQARLRGDGPWSSRSESVGGPAKLTSAKGIGELMARMQRGATTAGQIGDNPSDGGGRGGRATFGTLNSQRQSAQSAPAAREAMATSDNDDKRGRSLTIPPTRLTKAEIAEGIALAEYMDYRRPQTRAECASGPRPCPFVACKHHLYLDVNPVTDSIKINFPHLEVWEMQETCALDVADRGGQTLEEVGAIMNLTRERIRQVEVSGLERLQQEDFAVDLQDVFTS